jgi:hypothetical protein
MTNYESFISTFQNNENLFGGYKVRQRQIYKTEYYGELQNLLQTGRGGKFRKGFTLVKYNFYLGKIDHIHKIDLALEKLHTLEGNFLKSSSEPTLIIK